VSGAPPPLPCPRVDFGPLFVYIVLIVSPGVPHSLCYYFSDLERLFDVHYTPNEQDIVHCRARTIGITETRFNLRDHEMLMVDVGGQKSERRKWIHCFQDVTSILFLVSLSGYDQCLVEDRDAVRTPLPQGTFPNRCLSALPHRIKCKMP
jgi:hypothetical protein